MDRQMSDALRTCHGFCAPEGRITKHGNSPRRSPTSRSLLTPLLAGLKHQSLQHKGAAQREHAEDDILSDEEEEQCFTDSMEEEEEQHPLQRRYSTGAIPITNARRDYSHLIRKVDYERQCQQLLALAAKHSEALARQQGLREPNSVSAQSVQIRG